MKRPVPHTMLLTTLAIALVSAGCRGTKKSSGDPPLIPPTYADGPSAYDHGPDRFAPPVDTRSRGDHGSPLLPVPDSGPPKAPAVRSNSKPIPLPGPRSDRSAQRTMKAPSRPSGRRGTVLFPSGGDRGLMPASATDDDDRKPFWKLGFLRRSKPEVEQVSADLGESEMERRFRDLGEPESIATADEVTHNPIELDGIEFTEPFDDVEASIADVSTTPAWESFEPSDEDELPTWPFESPSETTLTELEAPEPEGATVPVSLERVIDETDDEETVANDDVTAAAEDESVDEPPAVDPDAPLPEIVPANRSGGIAAVRTPRDPFALRTLADR